MDPKIKAKFNDAILQEAMTRYAIAPDQIHLLDGFESFIYGFTRDNQDYILRLGHGDRRSVALIHGEVDWLNYLADGGATVARAILSQTGELVEVVDDGQGGHWLATAFVKAPGRPPQKEDWTPAFAQRYGQMVGKIHALSRHYRLSNPAWKRPEWDDPNMQEVEQHLPASEALAVTKYQELRAYLQRLPKTQDSYGMVHFDPHGGNFFVDETGQLTLFDFDDCGYCWFAYDIAMVLFYRVTGRDDAPALTAELMPPFLRGYSQETRLDPYWLAQLPFFLKQREIDLYALIHRSFDVANLTDPWCLRFMQDRKRRIEQDIPYIDYDFSTLARYL